jgi:hypothetical protein
MNAHVETVVRDFLFFVLARAGEHHELRGFMVDVHGNDVPIGVVASGAIDEIRPLKRLIGAEAIERHPDEAPEVVEVWV